MENILYVENEEVQAEINGNVFSYSGPEYYKYGYIGRKIEGALTYTRGTPPHLKKAGRIEGIVRGLFLLAPPRNFTEMVIIETTKGLVIQPLRGKKISRKKSDDHTIKVPYNNRNTKIYIAPNWSGIELTDEF